MELAGLNFVVDVIYLKLSKLIGLSLSSLCILGDECSNHFAL